MHQAHGGGWIIPSSPPELCVPVVELSRDVPGVLRPCPPGWLGGFSWPPPRQ